MKVKVSLDGKSYGPKGWYVEQYADVGEPAMVISNPANDSFLAITFENETERKRFAAGVAFCRATYVKQDGQTGQIYLQNYK